MKGHISRGDIGKVKKLFEEIPDYEINALDEHQKTLLHHALEYGIENAPDDRLDIACILLKAGGTLGKSKITEDKKDLLNKSLRCAASVGHEEAFELLLANFESVDINSQDEDGKTALMHASENGQNNLITKILERGDVDINLGDNSGDTAFDLLDIRGSESKDVVKLFLQKRARTTKRVFANEEYRIPASIMNIIMDDNSAVIHYAFDLGYEPAKSHILLLTAAENNNKDLVQRLLSVEGIDVNHQNASGKTAFDLFKFESVADAAILARFLIKRAKTTERKFSKQKNRIPNEIKAEIMDVALAILAKKDKQDPVNYAISLGYSVTGALVIVAHGESKNAVDMLLSKDNSSGAYALIAAAKANNIKAVEVLLGRPNIEPNIKDEEHKTALMYASELGHDEVVRMLINMPNITVNHRDSKDNQSGDTALICAADKTSVKDATRLNYINIVTHLLSRKETNVNIVGRKGYTAFSLFQFVDNIDVIGLAKHEAAKFTQKIRRSLELFFYRKINIGWGMWLSNFRGSIRVIPHISDNIIIDVLGKLLNKEDLSAMSYALGHLGSGYLEKALDAVAKKSDVTAVKSVISQNPKAVYDHMIDCVKKGKHNSFRTLLQAGIYEMKGMICLRGGYIPGINTAISYLPIWEARGSLSTVAVDSGHVNVVKVLLDEATYTDESSFYKTILKRSIRYDKLEIVRFLAFYIIQHHANTANSELEKAMPSVKLPSKSKNWFSNSPSRWGEIDNQSSEFLRDIYTMLKHNKKITDIDILAWATANKHKELEHFLNSLGYGASAEKEGRTVLTNAAFNNNSAAIDKLINLFGVSADSRDGNKNTALMLAAYKGNLKAVEQLLTLSDPKQSSATNEQANLGTSSRKVEAIIDINAQNTNKYTALMLAVQESHMQIVEKLLSRAEININLQNANGHSALMLALQSNNEDIISALLRNPDIDINLQDVHGNTALMLIAQERKCIGRVKELLSRPEIKTNAKNNEGQTALDLFMFYAPSDEYSEIAALFFDPDYYDLKDYLSSDAEVAKLFFEKGSATSRIKDSDNPIPNYIMRELLAQNNLAVNTHAFSLGYTSYASVTYFFENTSPAEVKELMSQKPALGAEILVLAIDRGDGLSINSLLSNQVPLNYQDNSGRTALMAAIGKCNYNVSSTLVFKDQDVGLSLQDDEGQTALMIAITEGHHKIANQLLLNNQVLGLNLQNKLGQTALMIAITKGYHDLANQMLANNQDAGLSLQNNEGQTALDLFLSKSTNAELLELLIQKEAIHGSKEAKVRIPDEVLTSLVNNLAESGNGKAIAHIISLGYVDIVKTTLMSAANSEIININVIKTLSIYAPETAAQILINAVQGGNAPLAKELLAMNDLLDGILSSNNGPAATALLIAAITGGYKGIAIRVARKTDLSLDLNTRDPHGNTALILAISKGYEDVAKDLLNHENIGINEQNNDGKKALDMFMQSSSHNAQLLELLLQKGATHSTDGKVQIPEKLLTTALIALAEKNDSDTIKHIISLNYNLSAALIAASKAENMAVVRILASHDLLSAAKLLASAVAEDKDALATELISIPKLDVNTRDDNDNTALILAADRGNKAIVDAFLQNDIVEINSQNAAGQTALMAAIAKMHDGIATKLLCTKGITLSLPNKEEQTALDLFILSKSDNAELLKLLFQKGATHGSTKDRVQIPEKLLTTALIALAEKKDVDTIKHIVILKYSLYDAIIHAAKSKNAKAVLKLIPHDLDAAAKVLISAVQNGKPNLAKLLAGIDVLRTHILSSEDELATASLLMTALENGDGLCTRVLANNAKLNVSIRDKNANTALMLALTKGYSDIAAVLLQKTNININAQNTSGQTALMIAIEKNISAIAYRLLENQDLELNLQNNEGKTVLELFASSGSTEAAVLERLFERKAEGNIADINPDLMSRVLINLSAKEDGSNIIKHIINLPYSLYSVLMHIANKDNMLAIQRLAPYDLGAASRTLVAAITKGYADITQVLMHIKGLDLNAKDHKGNTALIAAAVVGNENVINTLLQNDSVDVNAQNTSGQTALMIAIGKGAIALRLLRNQDVDLNLRNNEGKTALELFVGSRSTEVPVLMELLEKGAEGNIADIDAGLMYSVLSSLVTKKKDSIIKHITSLQYSLYSVFMHVAKKENSSIVQALAPYDLDAASRTLIAAITNEYATIIQVLLHMEGLDLNAKDHKGNTTLIAAAAVGNQYIVDTLLLNDNVDINAQNSNGKTALMAAIENGHDEIATKLLNSQNIGLDYQNIVGKTAIDFLSNTSSAKAGLVKSFLQKYYEKGESIPESIKITASRLRQETKERGENFLDQAIETFFGIPVQINDSLVLYSNNVGAVSSDNFASSTMSDNFPSQAQGTAVGIELVSGSYNDEGKAAYDEQINLDTKEDPYSGDTEHDYSQYESTDEESIDLQKFKENGEASSEEEWDVVNDEAKHKEHTGDMNKSNSESAASDEISAPSCADALSVEDFNDSMKKGQPEKSKSSVSPASSQEFAPKHAAEEGTTPRNIKPKKAEKRKKKNNYSSSSSTSSNDGHEKIGKGSFGILGKVMNNRSKGRRDSASSGSSRDNSKSPRKY